MVGWNIFKLKKKKKKFTKTFAVCLSTTSCTHLAALVQVSSTSRKKREERDEGKCENKKQTWKINKKINESGWETTWLCKLFHHMEVINERAKTILIIYTSNIRLTMLSQLQSKVPPVMDWNQWCAWDEKVNQRVWVIQSTITALWLCVYSTVKTLRCKHVRL